MDLDRIERALRDGPPDEPAYAPGRHRHRGRSSWRWLVAVPVVAVAVAVGLVAGGILAEISTQGVGRSDPAAISRALTGTWTSDQLTFQDWSDALLARGFTSDDIAAFLEHDPFSRTVSYRLTISDTRLAIDAIYDGRAPIRLGGGTWVVDPDGSVQYTEVVPGVAAADACAVRLRAAVGATSLAFEEVEPVNCDLGARLANTAFFGISRYARPGR
jgi:hypothetical protein